MTVQKNIAQELRDFADFIDKSYPGAYTRAEMVAPVNHPALGLSAEARKEAVTAINDMFDIFADVAKEDGENPDAVQVQSIIVLAGILGHADDLDQLANTQP